MNTQSLYIRRANSQDMSSVSALHETAYSGAGYMSGDNQEEKPPVVKDSDNDVTVFVACKKDEDQQECIIGTISMVDLEKVNSFPIVDDFPDGFRFISSRNQRCAIVWRLAIVQEFRHSLNIVFSLLKEVSTEGRRCRYERIVCAVNPKHYSFYKNRMAFTKIDECKNLTGLVNAPAFLLLGVMSTVRERTLTLCSRKDNTFAKKTQSC